MNLDQLYLWVYQHVCKKHIILLGMFFCFSCTQSPDKQENSQPASQSKNTNEQFVKKTSAETSINFKNTINDHLSSRYNVLTFQYMFNGGGVGVADLNNDGLQDIYFTGNMVPDELYINKGNFKFENISTTSGIQTKGWSTGVSFVDINKDGWLDIYVCKGGPELEPAIKQNKLFINQKNNTFKEAAKQCGLADNNISTQAAFFDYDKDGDLDCFVMNNAVYNSARVNENQERLKTDKSYLINNTSNLYQNNKGLFTNVTNKAGLEAFTYGLGLLIQDFNQDNWPDIYVANDYYLPDVMYINNGDGTFSDQIKQRTRQTSFYGMGIDAADINNDGFVDIAELDMSSSDHILNKTLMPSMNVNMFYTLVAHYRFQHQYMFNSLQLNNGNGSFSNIAQMAGMANTDWSWSILLADYNLDGWQDIHITNGLKKYLSDNDFRGRIDALNVKANAGQTITSQQKQQLYASMPTHKIANVLYKNNADLTFTETKNAITEQLNSNGAAFADLDNDGDLDLITNNLDSPASLFENKASNHNNYITVDVGYKNVNTCIKVYANKMVQTKQYHPVRGYQSSQDYRLNFGLNNTDIIDSIIAIWPNNTQTKLSNISANQFLSIQPEKTTSLRPKTKLKPVFNYVDAATLGIDFHHKENKNNDYEKEVLLPYLQSTLGPKIAKADLNNDGLDDFYIGGAAGQSGELYVQNNNNSFKRISGAWQQDAASEDLGSLFFDADNDGDLDLYVCSGGNAFAKNDPNLTDRLYINNGNLSFKKLNQLPSISRVTSVAAAADFDKDGDLDLFVGGRQQAQKYPLAETSYFLINQKGSFIYNDEIANLKNGIGLVNDAVWVDIDKDNDVDLVVATEWGPVHVFENEKGNFSKQNNKWNTELYKGWWQCLLIDDFDNDNDLDILAGNLGLNSKFTASEQKPFKVFAGDFDNNGSHDLFLSKKYKDDYVPVRGFQCSAEQMPGLQQQFSTYQSFANADISQIIGNTQNKTVLECTTFQTGVFINENNTFTFKPLPNKAQISPVLSIQSFDANNNGLTDLLVAGNIYNTEPETPRLDALSVQLLINEGNMQFQSQKSAITGLNIYADVKDMKLLKSGTRPLLISSANNQKPSTYIKQ